MPATEARFQCRHILADGRRCRSACLRHEEFCYYHHSSRKPVANPAGRKSRRGTFTLPRIEDRASILLGVNEILARIATNDVDARRAGRLLYALQIAACSMPRLAAAKPVDEEDSGLIEEVVQHPTYGEIAPRSELAQLERDKPRKSLAQELREEMEALEARNIAEFGACADVQQDEEDIPAPEPIHIQLNDMRIELLETREDLAKAKAQLAEAKAETQRAEEVMVWHMDRHSEARTEPDLLKSESQPATQPVMLPRLQAVAAPSRCHTPHQSVILSGAIRSLIAKGAVEGPALSSHQPGCPIHRAFVSRDEWASSEARPSSHSTSQIRRSKRKARADADSLAGMTNRMTAEDISESGRCLESRRSRPKLRPSDDLLSSKTVVGCDDVFQAQALEKLPR